MDEIRISANLMRELAAEPGLAFVYKEGRWKFSFWPKCRIRK